MIAHTIQGAINKKFEEVCYNEKTKHPYLKAFSFGMLDGVVDGCMIVGAMVLVTVVLQGVVNVLSNEK